MNKYIKLLLCAIICFCFGVLMSPIVLAHGNDNHSHDDHGDINIDIDIDNGGSDGGSGGTNNVDTNGVGCLCVSGGVTNGDVSRGLSLAMSAGGHELDYSTQDWQFSAVYARQVDEDEEGAYSFKLGKRWDKLGKALMHVTYVPEQGQDWGNWVVVGGTVRF